MGGGRDGEGQRWSKMGQRERQKLGGSGLESRMGLAANHFTGSDFEAGFNVDI